jgi:serine/threonine protein kinase
MPSKDWYGMSGSKLGLGLSSYLGTEEKGSKLGPSSTGTLDISSMPSFESGLCAPISQLEKEFRAQHGGFISPESIVMGKVMGVGSTARVLEGTYNGANVAVKMPKCPFGEDRDSSCEVLREVSILLTVHHPHILHFYGVCRFEKGLGLVMEVAENGSLFDYMRQLAVGKAETSTARKYMTNYMVDIADGLDYLHSRGILHGDLKPANVLLLGGSAKLCDFGLSRKWPSQNLDLGTSFQGCGTQGFMAPELLDKIVLASVLSPKLDIWALGCTIWAMVELRMPFQDESPSIFWVANFYKTGNRLPCMGGGWSLNLRQLVQACWHSDAAKRPTAKSCLKSLGLLIGADSTGRGGQCFFHGWVRP